MHSLRVMSKLFHGLGAALDSKVFVVVVVVSLVDTGDVEMKFGGALQMTEVKVARI